MKSLSLVCFLICLVFVSSRASFKSQLKLKKSESEACLKTSAFSAQAFLQVYLVSDTGKAMNRCTNCGPTANGVADTASVMGNVGDSSAKWRMYIGCEGKVAFQSIESGNYISRCRTCWQNALYVDGVFVVPDSGNDSVVQWNLINNGDGTYSFQGDIGNYLARCNKCVTGETVSDFAFVHATTNTVAYAKWKIVVF